MKKSRENRRWSHDVDYRSTYDRTPRKDPSSSPCRYDPSEERIISGKSSTTCTHSVSVTLIWTLRLAFFEVIIWLMCRFLDESCRICKQWIQQINRRRPMSRTDLLTIVDNPYPASHQYRAVQVISIWRTAPACEWRSSLRRLCLIDSRDRKFRPSSTDENRPIKQFLWNGMPCLLPRHRLPAIRSAVLPVTQIQAKIHWYRIEVKQNSSQTRLSLGGEQR